MDLSLDRVFRAAQVIPLLNGSLGDDLHACAHITLQMLRVSGGLGSEEAISGCRVEAAHLQLRNDETVLVDRVDDFASVHVCIGLDQCELSFFAPSEALASEGVTVVDDLELSGIDCDD